MEEVAERIDLTTVWSGIDVSLDRFRDARGWLVLHEIEFWNTFPIYCDKDRNLLDIVVDEGPFQPSEICLHVQWTFSSVRDAMAFKMRWG